MLMSEGLRTEENNNLIINKEEFNKLLSVFNVVSKLCTDLSIVEGKICQPSDRKSSIICIDTQSILNNLTIHLTGIAMKVGLLEPFRRQGQVMEIINEEDIYIIKDSVSQIKIIRPMEMYMTNPYISNEDLQNKLSIMEDEVIFEYELGKFIIDRLSAFQKGLTASNLKIEFRGNKADFIVNAADDSSSITIGKLVTIDLEKELTCDCVFPIIPFMLTDEKINIKAYLRNDNRNLLLNLDTTVEDVPVSIWCISEMIREEEDNAPF